MSLLGKWFGFSKDEVFDEAVSAFDRGDYEAAIEAFDECLADSPDTATARLAAFYTGESYGQLGNVCMEQRDPAEALRMFRAALKYCPNYPDLHLKAAKAADAMLQTEARDLHLRTALRLNPRYVDAVVFSGICAYADDRRQDGINLVGRACDLDPELNRSLWQRAVAADREGDYPRACDFLKALCPDNLNQASLFRRIGDGYMRDGMPSEAITAYAHALGINPRDHESHIRMGLACLSLRDFERALDAVDNAIRINPTSAEAHAQKGAILREMKMEIDAQCEFRRTMEIDPNHPVAIQERASLL